MPNSKLKSHPFAVNAFFKRSTVLTFSVQKEFLEPLLPDCLSLDTFNNKFGFIAAALVETKNLRPRGVPKFFGRDFNLIGYRIFVKYVNAEGKIRRGLYIIKSETNKASMAFFGNLFTHYNYTSTDISIADTEKETSISSQKSGFSILIDTSEIDPQLPEKSPFPDWKTARKFAGPLPFTFTVSEADKTILIIEGVRQQWKPKPICITHQYFKFIEDKEWGQIELASAFEIENVPYWWKKGVTEKW